MADLPDWSQAIDITSQSLTDVNVDIVAQTLAKMNIDIVAQTLADLNVDIVAQTLATMNMDIVAQTLATLAIDITAQTLSALKVNITAQTLATLVIDIAAQTLTTLGINIKAQDLAEVNIDLVAQTVRLYTHRDWGAKEGEDKLFTGTTSINAGAFATLIDYTVPAGTVLYLTELQVSGQAVGHAQIVIATTVSYTVYFDPSVSPHPTFSTPIVIDASTRVRVIIFNDHTTTGYDFAANLIGVEV